MLRVFDFRIPETDPPVTIKLASLTFRQAEEFVKESRELLNRELPARAEDWNDREHHTIKESMEAADTKITLNELREHFDIPTLHAMYNFILEKSGLRTTAPEGEGKAAATPISASSAAA